MSGNPSFALFFLCSECDWSNMDFLNSVTPISYFLNLSVTINPKDKEGSRIAE